ncbi:hypothetical protein ACQP1O_16620 [Nocardia sp. CA-151230]|uniref:hypothetical protein n=1 Tax=Nocardia sp. CA-151230 TaxID=3239982 RepID=UPI003D9300EF
MSFGREHELLWREQRTGAPSTAWPAADGRPVAVLPVDQPKELAAARRAIMNRNIMNPGG